MQIEYCEDCKTKLTEQAFSTGQAVWISNQPFCKDCGEKAAQAKAAASRSGARSTPARTTPPPGRTTPGQQGRKLNTPGTTMARRSGLHRATSGEPAKSSGTHARQSSPHGHAVSGSKQSPSVMMVSMIGAAIGVLLAVLVIMIFFR